MNLEGATVNSFYGGTPASPVPPDKYTLTVGHTYSWYRGVSWRRSLLTSSSGPAAQTALDSPTVDLNIASTEVRAYTTE